MLKALLTRRASEMEFIEVPMRISLQVSAGLVPHPPRRRTRTPDALLAGRFMDQPLLQVPGQQHLWLRLRLRLSSHDICVSWFKRPRTFLKWSETLI